MASRRRRVLTKASAAKSKHRTRFSTAGEPGLVVAEPQRLRGRRRFQEAQLGHGGDAERRREHFFSSSQQESRFDTREDPADAMTVDIGPEPETIVADIRRRLRI